MRTLLQILLLTLSAAALTAGAVMFLERTREPGVEILLPTATPLPVLKAYIFGAVARPGVYPVREGDRLEDLLALAGGPTQEADLTQVNQAQRVHDEDAFHIPKVGEALVTLPSVSPGLVNVNTATVEELMTVDGIGQVIAQNIVAYREEHGPFQRLEDLLQVNRIGPSTLEQIRPYLTVK